MINLRNRQKFGMINELKIRPASVENKNEQKVSVIPEMGQAPFLYIRTVRFYIGLTRGGIRMKAEILKLLREADGYVSGQQLCEKFGVSRTAVWKVIRQLQEEGYRVEAVRNKGYHIVDSPDVMTKEELDSLMDTQWAGRNIVYYDSVDSTNLRIKQMGDEGAPEGTLAVADKQTAGRGRRGRSWDSPSGSSIYMSLLLRPEIEPDQAPMLTLVMALSVAEGIMDCGDSCGNPDVKIK